MSETPAAMPTALERLLIEQACTRLIVEAAALADAGDACGLAALFTEDATLQRPSGPALTGRAAIEAAYAQRDPRRLTRHLVTNTRFTIESTVAVRARSLVLLWAGQLDDDAGPKGRPALPGSAVGEFDDRLVVVGGQWRIATRRASFVLHEPD